MNQRVPDSGGLPLRAMVMVLLFLAIIFLLLGINAVRTGSDSSSQATPVVTTTTTTTSTTPAAPVKPEVHVYNASQVPGLAAEAGGRLTENGWKAVVEQGNIELPPNVALPAVFFTEGDADEKGAADTVAQELQIDLANVIPRKGELADPPPGLIVVVTG
jgi:hypothetical protein